MAQMKDPIDLERLAKALVIGLPDDHGAIRRVSTRISAIHVPHPVEPLETEFVDQTEKLPSSRLLRLRDVSTQDHVSTAIVMSSLVAIGGPRWWPTESPRGQVVVLPPVVRWVSR